MSRGTWQAGSEGKPAQTRSNKGRTLQEQVRLLGGRPEEGPIETLQWSLREEKIIIWTFSLDYQLDLVLPKKGTELYDLARGLSHKRPGETQTASRRHWRQGPLPELHPDPRGCSRG